MTSVPYYTTLDVLKNHGTIEVKDHSVPNVRKLNSCLPTKHLKMRHIRSIFVKRIRYGGPNEDAKSKTCLIPKGSGLQVDLREPVKKKFIHDQDHPYKSIRKGKSSINLKESFTNPALGDNKQLIKDDSFLISNPYNSTNILRIPKQIQQQLDHQLINNETFFDCFYTINRFLDIDEPYFISRVFPSYVELEDELDLQIFENSATINLYIKSKHHPWNLLRQYHIKLSLLTNLGDDLDLIDKTLKDVENLLLLKLLDDCYYTLPSINISTEITRFLQQKYFDKILDKVQKFHSRQLMASYDQIMTLNNFSRCNQDLEESKAKLESRINQQLQTEDSFQKVADQINDTIAHTDQLRKLITKKNEHSCYTLSKLHVLKERKTNLEKTIHKLKYPASIPNSRENIEIFTDCSTLQMENDQVVKEMNLEKARISSKIQYIFPIQETSGKHDFSLFRTCFPSSLIPKHKNFDEESMEIDAMKPIIPICTLSQKIIHRLTNISRLHCERLNALIGYVSLIILTIAQIFNIPLRYPISYLGSNTYITDLISNFRGNDEGNPRNSTIYPLFICRNATLAIKFTYGLLLLRKNLEQLFEVEKIVKIEEFNLLTSCKIWLTCVEGYSDVINYQSENNNDSDLNSFEQPQSSNIQRYDEQANESFPDTETNLEKDKYINERSIERFSSDEATGSFSSTSPFDVYKQEGITKNVNFTNIPDDCQNVKTNSNISSKMFSNCSIKSKISRHSAVSGVSHVSVTSNASLIVNDHNQKLLSEDRIKHIKKHLLKGSNRMI